MSGTTSGGVLRIILVVILFLAVIVLVACVFNVLETYNKEKGYKPAVCSSESIIRVGEKVCSTCEDGNKKNCYNMSHPCVEIVVSFTTEGATSHDAILYSSAYVAEEQNGLCSETSCVNDELINIRKVNAFVDEYASRTQPYQCFYNTNNRRYVIPKHTYTYSEMVHSIVWPSLVIVAVVTIFIVLHRKWLHRELSLPTIKCSKPSITLLSCCEKSSNEIEMSDVDEYAVSTITPCTESTPSSLSRTNTTLRGSRRLPSVQVESLESEQNVSSSSENDSSCFCGSESVPSMADSSGIHGSRSSRNSRNSRSSLDLDPHEIPGDNPPSYSELFGSSIREHRGYRIKQDEEHDSDV